MLPQMIEEIANSSTTLVFFALHHGSLERSVYEWLEPGLKNGELKAVVCTSSLDRLRIVRFMNKKCL